MAFAKLGRGLATAALLLALLAAVSALGPRVARTVTPDRLAAAQDLIDHIWWPAGALRLAVYILLAWVIYPAWVRERAREPAARRNRLPPPGVDAAADAWRERLDARLDHLNRAASRQHPVFWMLLAGDLIFAQLPYWLLRG